MIEHIILNYVVQWLEELALRNLEWENTSIAVKISM